MEAGERGGATGMLHPRGRTHHALQGPRGWEAEPASESHPAWLSKAGTSRAAEMETRQPPHQDRGAAGGERGASSPRRLHSWAKQHPPSKVISNQRRSNYFFHGHCIFYGNLAGTRHQSDISLVSTGAAENESKVQAITFPCEPGPLALHGPGAFTRRKEEEIEALV